MTSDIWYCPEQAALYHWDANIWLAEVETQQVTIQQRQADGTILFRAVTHVTTGKYIGLLVSPHDPKEGKVVKTQSQPQVKNYWHDGLIKLLSFPMAIRSCWETSTSLVIGDSTVRIQSYSYSRAEMPLASIGAALVWNSWNVKCVFAETDSAEDYADIIMLLFSPLLSFYII